MADGGGPAVGRQIAKQRMNEEDRLGFDALNAALKAAGEETRLRVLALLAEAELTVSDLTDILRQSQPRISRHLRLLAEAGKWCARQGMDLVASEADGAAARPVQPDDGARQRRLARAALADNADGLALRNLQVDAIQRPEDLVAG